jgi:hypothetical protein
MLFTLAPLYQAPKRVRLRVDVKGVLCGADPRNAPLTQAQQGMVGQLLNRGWPRNEAERQIRLLNWARGHLDGAEAVMKAGEVVDVIDHAGPLEYRPDASISLLVRNDRGVEGWVSLRDTEPVTEPAPPAS